MKYQLNEEDKNNKDNEKLKADLFPGPGNNKKCTDCLFLIFIILCWGVMTGIGLCSIGYIEHEDIPQGNPYILINGIDYKGDICGVDSGVKNKKHLYYITKNSAVCVESCPKVTAYDEFICKDDYVPINKIDGVNQTRSENGFKCKYHIATKPVFFECLYNEKKDINRSALINITKDNGWVGEVSLVYESDNSQTYIEKWTGDIFRHADVIFGIGIGLTTVLSFIYLFVLRIPSVLFILIWSIIIFILLLLLAIGAFFINTSNEWDGQEKYSQSSIDALLYLGYFFILLTFLWICLILFMRKRIMLALGIVKEAAKSIAQMPLLILFPFVQVFFICIFLTIWFIYLIFLATAGDKHEKEINGETVVAFTYNAKQKYIFLYMIYIAIYTITFIGAIGSMYIALCVSKWYFTRKRKKMNMILIPSFFHIIRYHLGTCAYGSFIIAVIATIRVVLAYIVRKTPKETKKNILIKQMIICLQCCLYCIQKIMKFINKNAYIMTAIYGYSFCKGARTAFYLIARNIARVASVSIISTFVLFLGRLLVPLVCLFISYHLFTNEYEVDTLVITLAFICLISYLTVCLFTDVFDMCISTILICFIGDEEMNKGTNNIYAPKSLRRYIKGSKKYGQSKVHPNDNNKENNTENDEELP